MAPAGLAAVYHDTYKSVMAVLGERGGVLTVTRLYHLTRYRFWGVTSR